MRFSLLVLLFLISNASWACSCGLDVDLNNEPLRAEFSFIGQYQQVKGQYSYMKPMMEWTKHTPKFKIENSSTCDFFPKMKQGSIYLVLVAKEDKPSDHILGFCNSSIISLENARMEVDKLSKNNTENKLNPSWLYCVRDFECVTTKNKCNSFLAFNKRYSTEFLKFINSENSKCNKSIERKYDYKPVCENKFCK
jgi:hypothetical protein